MFSHENLCGLFFGVVIKEYFSSSSYARCDHISESRDELVTTLAKKKRSTIPKIFEDPNVVSSLSLLQPVFNISFKGTV